MSMDYVNFSIFYNVTKTSNCFQIKARIHRNFVSHPRNGWKLIDDFQIYNRALSAEEVLWNAGVTTPIDKPF